MQVVLDYLIAQLPTTALGWTAHIGIGAVMTYVVISFVEHWIHKNMMHFKNLPNFAYVLPVFDYLWNEHAVLHHGKYYKQFDYEPDEDGKHRNLTTSMGQQVQIGLVISPFILLVTAISPVVGVIFCLGGLAHVVAWNTIHTQMHIPRDVWWAKTTLFRRLAFHHFMHHRAAGNNMNVVCPFADFVLGTVATPRLGDVRETMRLGYVVPRSPRGKKLQAAMAPRKKYALRTPAAQPAAPLRAAA